MPKLPTAPLVESMYPSLAGVEPQQDNGSSFRLTEIRNLERRLEQERDHRANMYKKYRSCSRLWLAGIAGKYISRWLLVKATKHDEIRVLALSKLNSITDVISNALRDGHISPEEFKLVLDEMDTYGLMKASIREKTRKAHAAQSTEVEKNALMVEARASIMKELSAATLK